MNCLLDMVALHVRKFPHVAGILAQRITGQFADVRPLEVPFVRILRWNPDRVEVECVIIGLGEPVNRLIAS